MNETTGKSKSRLGRNLSALLNHSEESLLKAMRWKGGGGDGSPGIDEESLPIETITLPSAEAFPVDAPPEPATTVRPRSGPEPAAAAQPQVGVTVEEEWSLKPADGQPSVLYQIRFQQRLLAPEEESFPLEAGKELTLEVALQLPLLKRTQPVPPVVSRLHVYLLLFDAEKGARVRLEAGSTAIEPGQQEYDFRFRLDGIAAGRWDLAVQVYAALYDFAERRVLHLQVV